MSRNDPNSLANQELIRNSIGPDQLAAYLTADDGYKLGVYADGSVHVGPTIGEDIEPSDRPVAWVRCPGIGAADMTFWRQGWDCEELSDEEVIRDCCENGDVADDVADLVRRLLEEANEYVP